VRSKQTQLLCLWCGPAAIVVFLAGFWLLAGLLPPISPDDTAREIQAIYQDNTDLKRAGFVLIMIGGALTGPFAAAICTQMRRVEGEDSPLAYTELGMGMIGVLLFVIPSFLMQAAAFRPDRDPELIQLINDAAWLPFIGAFAAAVIQNIAIAVVAFRDEEAKVFPRWLGYFNIWVALLFLPAGLIYFFKTGPFAWDGIFCFWLPLTVFSAWFAAMFVVLRQAILRQDAEATAAAAA
jgi:hypothetical protein